MTWVLITKRIKQNLSWMHAGVGILLQDDPDAPTSLFLQQSID